MKRSLQYLSMMLLAVMFVSVYSCSSDGDGGDDTPSATITQLSTLAAQVEGTMVTLGGNITVAGDQMSDRGVCWSTQSNPTINDEYQSDQASGGGEYQIAITGLLPQTTYYARAYAADGNSPQGIVYGNQVTFTTGSSVATFDPVSILTTSATLKGHVTLETPGSIGYPAFVYNTSPNPTINNFYASTTIVGSDDYSVTIENLLPNTVYYVRAYHDGSYGEQKQIRTTGYPGPAGGYVVYDAGVVTDGWRYIEFHPTAVNYYSNATGAEWGNYDVFISGTSSQFGTGPSNTAIIANATSQPNCAAKLCQNLVRNGYSDWFLGSSDEMLVITNALRKAGIATSFMWTSTQTDAQSAKAVYYESASVNTTLTNYFKDFDLTVCPLRRY